LLLRRRYRDDAIGDDGEPSFDLPHEHIDGLREITRQHVAVESVDDDTAAFTTAGQIEHERGYAAECSSLGGMSMDNVRFFVKNEPQQFPERTRIVKRIDSATERRDFDCGQPALHDKVLQARFTLADLPVYEKRVVSLPLEAFVQEDDVPSGAADIQACDDSHNAGPHGSRRNGGLTKS